MTKMTKMIELMKRNSSEGADDRLQAKKSLIRRHYVQTKVGFIVARSKARRNTEFHSTKGDESSSTYKKEKRKLKRVPEAID